MSRHRKARHALHSGAAAPRKKWPWAIGGAAVVVATVVAWRLWPSADAPPSPSPRLNPAPAGASGAAQVPPPAAEPAKPKPPAPAETKAGPPTSAVAAVRAKFLGKWQRPGEPYVLEFRSVADDGRIEAAYFNPRPIRVGKAEVRQTPLGPGVYVEMNDINYTGSNYTLIYDEKNGILQGLYYQATMGQTHEVVFERTR